jgi:hypothetical protein
MVKLYKKGVSRFSLGGTRSESASLYICHLMRIDGDHQSWRILMESDNSSISFTGLCYGLNFHRMYRLALFVMEPLNSGY